MAYLCTYVITIPSLPARCAEAQEWLWFQVNWLDGRRDCSEEDYGPEWLVVEDLEGGTFDYRDRGQALTLDAKPVSGEARDALWARYGPPD
jgi:hypothetical protein